MATITGRFYHLIQDSEQQGGDDEHLIFRVAFSLALDGKELGDRFYANIKQTVGSNIQDYILEVSEPGGYSGAWDHMAFTREAERYFRALVSPQGRAIRLPADKHGTMTSNFFQYEMEFFFPVST